MNITVDIADDLFVAEPAPALIGGRYRATGRIVFPLPAGRDDYEAVILPRRGHLWSWTVQRFRPKTPPYRGPEDFVPFALGYVELEGAVIVETPLADVRFEDIAIGMEMETVLIPFSADAEGRIVRTFAFAPVKPGGAA